MGQRAVAKADKAKVSDSRDSQVESRIDSVLAEFKRDPDELIPALQAVQRKIGYLPPETFKRAGLHFRIPDSRVYGVATFYPQFDLEQPCTHSIKVCGCTACYIHGSGRIISAIRKKFGIKPGQRTPDGKLMLERMSRCGSPSLAPVVVIDGKTHGRTSPEKIVKLIEGLV
jgi:NADH-quinone oxidoreductase subunit E